MGFLEKLFETADSKQSGSGQIEKIFFDAVFKNLKLEGDLPEPKASGRYQASKKFVNDYMTYQRHQISLIQEEMLSTEQTGELSGLGKQVQALELALSYCKQMNVTRNQEWFDEVIQTFRELFPEYQSQTPRPQR